jgi:Fic family protein
MFGNFVVQPNGDGNKRTGFILGNKVLLDYNLTPVHFKKNEENMNMMFNFWKNMYSWKPFLNGQEVYHEEYYKPFIDKLEEVQKLKFNK